MAGLVLYRGLTVMVPSPAGSPVDLPASHASASGSARIQFHTAVAASDELSSTMTEEAACCSPVVSRENSGLYSRKSGSLTRLAGLFWTQAYLLDLSPPTPLKSL